METFNSPLATVIKLNSAEALLDFSEAKKYQDINKIYRDSTNSKAKPEDIWREFVTSANSLTKSKIFTNQWKYFDYDITERINGANAVVILKSKSSSANIRAIIYKLEYQQSVWIVNAIDFERKE